MYGRVGCVLFPSSPFALNRERPSFRGGETRRRRSPCCRSRLLCPVRADRRNLAATNEAGDVLRSPLRKVGNPMSVRVEVAIASICRGGESDSIGGFDRSRAVRGECALRSCAQSD